MYYNMSGLLDSKRGKARWESRVKWRLVPQMAFVTPEQRPGEREERTDRRRSGAGGLCKGPGVSLYQILDSKAGQPGRVQSWAPAVGNEQDYKALQGLWI